MRKTMDRICQHIAVNGLSVTPIGLRAKKKASGCLT